jgi:hypothetical protein
MERQAIAACSNFLLLRKLTLTPVSVRKVTVVASRADPFCRSVAENLASFLADDFAEIFLTDLIIFFGIALTFLKPAEEL